MIQLVCFDLGGVVIRIHYGWKESAKHANVPLRRPDLLASRTDALKELGDHYQCGRLRCEQFADEVARVLEHSQTPQEVLAMHRGVIGAEFPGVCEVVDGLHARGRKTAILSNTNRAHWQQVGHWPTLTKIPVRILSHEIGAIKPQEAAYRSVEEQAQVAADNVLFFDDTWENVEAARRFGWKAEQIDPFQDPKQQLETLLRQYGL